MTTAVTRVAGNHDKRSYGHIRWAREQHSNESRMTTALEEVGGSTCQTEMSLEIGACSMGAPGESKQQDYQRNSLLQLKQ